MKFLQITAVVGCLGLVTIAQSGEASESVAQKCNVCHQGDMSLSSQNEDELTGKIKGLLTDLGKHPPFQLEDTSDAAIEALVKALLAK